MSEYTVDIVCCINTSIYISYFNLKDYIHNLNSPNDMSADTRKVLVCKNQTVISKFCLIGYRIVVGNYRINTLYIE